MDLPSVAIAPLKAAVMATLGALDLEEKDEAAARLAISYATAIDRAVADAADGDEGFRKTEQAVLDRLGSRLESILVQLGATPTARSRNALPDGPAPVSRLEALRASRAA